MSEPSKKRILVVDDDPEIVGALRTVLEAEGYEVFCAANGYQGQVLAEQYPPDLIILDMMMPKRGGFPVLESMARKPGTPPIIMITANEGSRHKAYAEMLGVFDYIRKPFAVERLLESVQRALAEREKPAEPAPEPVEAAAEPKKKRSTRSRKKKSTEENSSDVDEE